ncbi:GntR family transcriptional regulator [Oricola cellulosilytica]|uniref:GntR family transcriptional regulator n=1 Tax=Oricola cellulosilytica TaxID=1429082 RepID=A0A4V2MNR2_9HYPH|nr:GntR family transcriptional regulator [Oricola cellulosilytica]TCD14207.1 GntR family transcriptional regulator [Oricola cellulosilytica]
MSLADVEPVETLSRPALAVELTDRLRTLIMEGELKPGEKIPERLLTERFGVSRTPVREAVKVLAAEGLVMLVQNRGAVVSELTVAELEEVFPVLAALEGLVGELAALHATTQEIDDIRRLNNEMHRAFDRGDRPNYFEINQQIHAAMLAAARNPTLAQHHQIVARRASRARYQANLTPERWAEAMEEHDAIQRAFEARESKKLGALMKAHMEHKLRSLAPAIAAKSGGG